MSQIRVSRWFGKLAAAALLLVTAGLYAADLIPVPDFTEYRIPISQNAPTENPVWEWANVLILIGALALASYLALIARSRRGLLTLSIASLVWFGFVREGCVCPIGATQNVALALFDSSDAVPVTIVAIFAIPLVFTLFFGRTFCAAVCPLGAIQEVVAVRTVRVPSWLDHSLGLIPYLYLGVALIFAVSGAGFVICRYDPFVAMFRMSGDWNMLVFGACLLFAGVLIGRPYCRYLCPYGGILALLSKASKWHTAITPNECIQCQLCENSCPYGAIETPSTAMPRDQLPAGRKRLALMLGLLPLLAAFGAGLGTGIAVPLSRMDFQVSLAERIRLEEAGKVEGMTDASEAYRNTGKPIAELYATAIDRRHQYRSLGGWLGVWVGLVIGIKLVTLSLRRRRTDYQPDRTRCVSCGRCYWYCPNEQVRLGLIQDVSEMVDIVPPNSPSKP